MLGGEIRIGLVDGDESIREGRRLLLNVPTQSVVVFEADRASVALEAIESHLVDVVLVDQRIQGMTGVELCKGISRLRLDGKTSAHVLMTAPFANDALRLAAIRAGAQELISQEQGREDLVTTIRKLVGGEVCVDLASIRLLLGRFQPAFDKSLVHALESFSPRERTYIRSVVSGEPIGQIAAKFSVAAYRVRKPVEKILADLGLVTLEQLQLRFLEAGVLDETFEPEV